MVAILNEDKTAVKEIRNLGPNPVPVKAGFVLPYREVKPALGADQYYNGFSDNIQAVEVIRTFTVATFDYDASDTNSLNAALMEPGSVLRALAEVVFVEINKLRVKTGDAAYTKQQFVQAIKAKMR